MIFFQHTQSPSTLPFSVPWFFPPDILSISWYFANNSSFSTQAATVSAAPWTSLAADLCAHDTCKLQRASVLVLEFTWKVSSIIARGTNTSHARYQPRISYARRPTLWTYKISRGSQRPSQVQAQHTVRPPQRRQKRSSGFYFFIFKNTVKTDMKLSTTGNFVSKRFLFFIFKKTLIVAWG